MEGFIIKYYNEIKEMLRLGSLKEKEQHELAFEANLLKEQFYKELDKRMTPSVYEFDGEKAVSGLFKKFDRLFGDDTNYIVRDVVSKLAQKLDWGMGLYIPPCPYSDDDLSDIQKKITDFISQRARTAENEFSQPLLTGDARTELYQDQMNFIVNNLIQISHSITDYVDHYDDGNWKWSVDCAFIMQYVFEKAAEITYMVAKGEPAEGIAYDIREAFTYFQTEIPEEFQEKIDSVINQLDDIVLDIISYIDKYDYDTCSKEIWFRPIVFNIALEGMLFTLEQDL